MILLLAVLMQLTPVVQNHTSIALIGSDRTERGIVLHLKNTSSLAILGITVTHGESNEEQELANLPTQSTAPGALFDFRFNMTEEQMEDRSQLLIVRAVLFEDLSGSGDAQWIEMMTARLKGGQKAARVILQAIAEESRPGMLLSNVEFSEGRLGDGDSVAAPPEFRSKRSSFAFAGGYLSVKENALRELKRLDKGSQRQQIADTSIEDLKTQLENTLQLGRVK